MVRFSGGAWRGRYSIGVGEMMAGMAGEGAAESRRECAKAGEG